MPPPLPPTINASLDNRLCQLRGKVLSTVLAVLVHALFQHQNWFNVNDVVISNLLAEKSHPHKAYVNRPTDDNKAAFYRHRRLSQQRLRKMQDAWTAREAEKIRGAVGGTQLIEKKRILHRWSEHFRSAHNCPYTIFDDLIARLPQVETNVDLELHPSLYKTIKGIAASAIIGEPPRRFSPSAS
ncbi:hypothetical protein SprV_0100154500 [Sparganum proliferum]